MIFDTSKGKKNDVVYDELQRVGYSLFMTHVDGLGVRIFYYDSSKHPNAVQS